MKRLGNTKRLVIIVTNHIESVFFLIFMDLNGGIIDDGVNGVIFTLVVRVDILTG